MSSPHPATASSDELEGANLQLASASAEQILRWAASRYGGRLALSSSFGAHSAVMLHLLSQHAPGVPVILIDTGYLFEETYRFARDLTESLALDVRVYVPRISAAHQEALHGRRWEQGEQGVAEYLRVNKIEPMQRALRELGAEAWLAGLRAAQSSHRATLPIVGRQDGLAKIHPILRWSDADVDRYLRDHDLPLHPLCARGYRSIGDRHSTFPTLPHQDARDGRLLGQKRECGLHLELDEAQGRSLTGSRL